jgi:hypothetical protein
MGNIMPGYNRWRIMQMDYFSYFFEKVHFDLLTRRNGTSPFALTLVRWRASSAFQRGLKPVT